MLYAQVSLDGPCQIAVAVVEFGLTLVAPGGDGSAFEHSLPAVVVAGGITVSTTILPDVPGPLILLILGRYEYMNAALNTFIDSFLDVAGGAPLSVAIEPGTVIITFMVGVVVGLFSTAHVIRWTLEHYRRMALASLVNLIVGTFCAPVVESIAALANAGRSWAIELYAAFVVAAVIGAAAVLFVDRHTDVIES